MGSYTSVIIVAVPVADVVSLLVGAGGVAADVAVAAGVYYYSMCHKLFVALALAAWLRTFVEATFACLIFVVSFIYLPQTTVNKHSLMYELQHSLCSALFYRSLGILSEVVGR